MTAKRHPGLLSRIVAVVLGIPGSFVVGAAVFADGADILSSERLLPVIATYSVLGAIFSSIATVIYATAPWLLWGTLLSIPALFAIFLLGSDIGLTVQLLYLVTTWAAACLGTYGGMWLALRLVGKKRDGS